MISRIIKVEVRVISRSRRLRLITLTEILKENAFHFNGKNYPQTHGTAMGTKMVVFFANIFMAAVEKS